MVVNNYFKDLLQSLDENAHLTLPPLKQKSLKIEYENTNEFTVIYSGQEPALPFAESKIHEVEISEWRRLSAVDNSTKAAYEISFNISGLEIDYKPGDTIGIIPENNENEVEAVINHLNLVEVVDCYYTVTVDIDRKGAKIPPHIPSRATLRYVLTKCVDLRGVVKKLFLLALSNYTKEESERKIIEYMCSKEGTLAYNTHILNKSICVLDLFQIFKSCKPPIEVILEHLPRLLPRPYSICNSIAKSPEKLKICFSVQDIGNERRGLTTGRLEDLINKEEDDFLKRFDGLSLNKELPKVSIYLRKNMNDFRIPENLTIPLILIGPGTGVAPFIGFLEERQYILDKNPDLKPGFLWLFNGCRDPKLDFIYEEELNGFVAKGVLNKMSTAFSRIGDAGSCYVQDLIERNGEEVSKLIVDGAHVYVCGDVNTMAKDVRQRITKCVEKYTNKTAEEAELFVTNMVKEKRYIVDVWN